MQPRTFALALAALGAAAACQTYQAPPNAPYGQYGAAETPAPASDLPFPEGSRSQNAVFRSDLQAEVPETRFLKSERGFADTNRQLRAALESRGLSVFTTVDHAANARQAGLSLEPMRLYIFGNPQTGTPFMAAEPLMGLELPLRMLVYARGGEVFVAYPDLRGIAAAYGISEDRAPVARVAGALDAIADAAAFDRDEDSGAAVR